VVRISKSGVEKIGKQYEIIEDIRLVKTKLEDNQNDNCNHDTMTDMTLVEGASPSFKENDVKEEEIMVSNGDNSGSADNKTSIDYCAPTDNNQIQESSSPDTNSRKNNDDFSTKELENKADQQPLPILLNKKRRRRRKF
jgi:hypothetical protein